MIHRFIAEATGAAVADEEAVELLTSVQQAWPEPRPTLLERDHAIWRQQNGRALN